MMEWLIIARHKNSTRNQEKPLRLSLTVNLQTSVTCSLLSFVFVPFRRLSCCLCCCLSGPCVPACLCRRSLLLACVIAFVCIVPCFYLSTRHLTQQVKSPTLSTFYRPPLPSHRPVCLSAVTATQTVGQLSITLSSLNVILFVCNVHRVHSKRVGLKLFYSPFLPSLMLLFRYTLIAMRNAAPPGGASSFLFSLFSLWFSLFFDFFSFVFFFFFSSFSSLDLFSFFTLFTRFYIFNGHSPSRFSISS